MTSSKILIEGYIFMKFSQLLEDATPDVLLTFDHDKPEDCKITATQTLQNFYRLMAKL